MNTISVKPIDTSKAEQYRQDSALMLKESGEIIIKDQPHYEEAAGLLQLIKGKAKELEVIRKGITQPLDQAKKAVMDLFRVPQSNYVMAERKLKTAMISYTEEQERIRREEEDRLRKETEAKEAKEKEKLLKKAEKAEEKGNTEKAEELREQAEDVTIIAPKLASTTEQPNGISYKEKWTAEVVDFKALPDEYKISNMPMLNKMAQATKGVVPIPGVKFHCEKVVASSSI